MRYKIDIKQLLKEHANWSHPNFGIVASFFNDWDDKIYGDEIVSIYRGKK